MAKEVIMPVLGMNQETGTLVEWLKAEGEAVTKGEPLMVVATDKTEVEIEATASGTLANVTVQPGDEVPVGSTLALLLGAGESAPASSPASDALTKAKPSSEQRTDQPPSSGQPAETNPVVLPATPVASRIAAEHGVDLSTVQAKGERIQKEDVLAHLATQEKASASPNGRILASPKARRLAQEKGIDLALLAGSGPDGAILTADILAVQPQPPPSGVLSGAEGSHQPPATSHQPPATTAPMSRTWKVMAQRLQESWQTVPHFYLEREVDAKALLKWRKRIQKRGVANVTVTDLLTKLVAASLQEHPRLNASWIDDQIQINEEINVGLAVAVEEGLLVPVVHRADQLSVTNIAERRAEVVDQAQTNTLGLDAVQGGTFTISNLGMFGITKFNAIVNPPQAAILAVGAIEERVVAVQGKSKVCPMLTLTLSCDHRVVDGARGAHFMQMLCGYLEDPLSVME